MTTPISNQYLKISRRGRGLPSYVSGQSPLRYPSLTNLGLWLKADQISASSGDALGTWSDQSGNGRDASQGNAGNKPLYFKNVMNGLSGVWFDGTNYFAAITMTTPAWGATVGTFYMTCTPSKSAWTPFGWSNRTDEYWCYNSTTSYIGMFRSARLEAASIAFPIAGSQVLTVLSGASAYNVYSNNTSLYSGSSSWGVPATAYLGTNLATNSPYGGFIYEILIYNVEHDAAQMQSIWNYLKWKWNIG